MYGQCQASEHCTNSVTHLVQFDLQPKDPLKCCRSCAARYRQPGNTIERIS